MTSTRTFQREKPLISKTKAQHVNLEVYTFRGRLVQNKYLKLSYLVLHENGTPYEQSVVRVFVGTNAKLPSLV